MLITEIEAAAHDREFLFFTTHVNDPLPAAVGVTVLVLGSCFSSLRAFSDAPTRPGRATR